MKRSPSSSNQPDSEVTRLAVRIRDAGTAPGRDLWPGINAAIEQEEHRFGNRTGQRKRRSLLRPLAAAAAVAVLLTAGRVGIHSLTGNAATGVAYSPSMVSAEETMANELAATDKALKELTLALARNPQDRNLSHLMLMVHKTRGNLLRRNTENLVPR